MRIVVSGGTGFIGRSLVARLLGRGDEVVVLTRSGKLPENLAGQARASALAWDPPAPGAWQKSIDGADAVVHLAGEQAVGQRYTETVKKRIFASRVTSAERLVEAVAKAEKKPRVFVSASGVGYYGGRLDDTPLDESAPAGSDFLADVCVHWEAAARAASEFGTRVAIARTGVVFGKHGGALETMSKPFKLFVGGPIASGRQYFSWIHLEDVVAVYLRLLDDDVSGPVNAVAPEAVPQGELARALGRALGRPALLPAPSFALRALFGEGATPLLTGQNAVPHALEKLGFTWKFPTLEGALRDCLA